MFLRLSQIYLFVNGDINSRNVSEGEEVLKSGQIVTVGCTKSTKVEKQICGLVLQTSAMSSFPHTIEGFLKIENQKAEINKMQCSCKAGLSGSCKHVVALLLFMERNDINQLEDLSCTDLKCVWSCRRSSTQTEFAPAPVSTFSCCVKPTTSDDFTLEEEDPSELFKALCSLNPNSALALHAQGRGTAQKVHNGVDEISKKDISEIIRNSSGSESVRKIASMPLIKLRDCCAEVLNSLVVSDPSALCYKTAKHYELWKEARQLRVSGSRIYSLYTYCKNKNPNWEQKSRSYFWPKDFLNKFVKHGLTQEQFARVAYEKKCNVNVVQCGFVVHPDCSWIGYSPDGIVFENNVPELLIEIKCVYAGKSKPVYECLAACPFLQNSNTIKRKHPYHGQVQLGMLLLNVKKCDFIIYASWDESLHVIRVDFDEKFALDMVSSVRAVYMEKMVHNICIETEKSKED